MLPFLSKIKMFFNYICCILCLVLLLCVTLPFFSIHSFATEIEKETTTEETEIINSEESSIEELITNENEEYVVEESTIVESEESQIEETSTEEYATNETEESIVEESTIVESEESQIKETSAEEYATNETEESIVKESTIIESEESQIKETSTEEYTTNETEESIAEESTIIESEESQIKETTNKKEDTEIVEPEESTIEDFIPEEIPETDEYGHKLNKNGDIIDPISHDDETEEFYYPEEPECDEEPEIDELYFDEEIDLSYDDIIECEDIPEELDDNGNVVNTFTPEEETELSEESNKTEEQDESIETTSIENYSLGNSNNIIEEESFESETTESETAESETTESETTESETTESETTESETTESETTESETIESLSLETTEDPLFTVSYTGVYVDGSYKGSYACGSGYIYQLPSSHPNKTGYTWQYWTRTGTSAHFYTNTKATVVKGKMYFTSYYTENSYAITYHLGDVKYEGISYNSGYTPTTSRLYTHTATYPTDADIISDGWDFNGWYNNDTFTGSPVTSIGPNSINSAEIYAKWSITPGYHSVTFDTRGGSSIRTRSVLNGNLTTQPSDPTLSGRTFVGWYVPDGSGGWDPFNFTTTPITNDIVISAFWDVVPPHDVNIHYIVDGIEKFTDNFTAVPTDGANLPIRNKYEDRKGFIWKGWDYNGTKYIGGQNYDFPNLLVNDMTFTAIYDPIIYNIDYSIDKYYGVEFFTGGLEAQEHRKVYEETNLYQSNKIDFHENWSYVGWFDNEPCTGSVKTKVPAGTAKNRKYYVKFVPGKNYHLVTFDSDGGTPVPFQSIKNGEQLACFIQPSRGEDKFIGWYEHLGGDRYREFTLEDKVYRDLTLVAIWNTAPPPIPREPEEHQERINGLVQEEPKILSIISKNIEGFSKVKYDDFKDKFYREKAEEFVLNFVAPDKNAYHLRSLVANEWIGVIYNDKTNQKVHWYYIDENNNYTKGFKNIDGYVYYFDETNEMVTGDLIIGLSIYHFSDKDDETLGRFLGAENLYSNTNKK